MNNLKKLYETPEVEEIVFASQDAIALSEGKDDSNETVGDNFNPGGGWDD